MEYTQQRQKCGEDQQPPQSTVNDSNTYFSITSLVSSSPLSSLSTRFGTLNQLSLPGPPRETNYTALSPVDDDASHTHISDDTGSTYSTAAPQFGYRPYRPPPQQSDQARLPSRQPSLAITHATHSTRSHTPPLQHCTLWPGIASSRTPPRSQTQPFPSRSLPLGVRAQQTQPYDESLPWANHSTHFRTTFSNSAPYQYEASICSEDTPRPSKQYIRNPRHIRETWQSGNSKRFPWKGMGAMLGVLLLTGTSVTLLFAFSSTPKIPTSIAPSTLLSALDILTTFLTLLALHTGITLSFWTQMLHGTSLSSIQSIHKCSTSLSSSLHLLLKRTPNKTAFATLFSVLSLSRGPLFQASLTLQNTNQYILHPAFMATGLCLSFAAVFAILPLYYGYWKLGRSVSLSPLEIARAFGAPVLDGLDGNVSAADVECARGHVYVRYGVVERNGMEKVLRVADVRKGNVRRPREDEIFG